MNTKTFFDVQGIPARLALVVVSFTAFVLIFIYTDNLPYAGIVGFGICIIGIIVFWRVIQANEAKHLRLQKEKTEKAKQERIAKAEDLVTKIQSEDIKPQWSDIVFVLENLALGEEQIALLLTKLKFIDLFQVSHIKKHFIWKGISGPLLRINAALQWSYEDSTIEMLVAEIKTIEQYREYEGYNALYKELSHYSAICDLVKLKAPCKKELVS